MELKHWKLSILSGTFFLQVIDLILRYQTLHVLKIILKFYFELTGSENFLTIQILAAF